MRSMAPILPESWAPTLPMRNRARTGKILQAGRNPAPIGRGIRMLRSTVVPFREWCEDGGRRRESVPHPEADASVIFAALPRTLEPASGRAIVPDAHCRGYFKSAMMHARK